MGKGLLSLISLCCLSGFMIADVTDKVTNKEIMASCAMRYLQENSSDSLTIDNLTSDKQKLVRQVSEDLSSNFINLSLDVHQKALLKILIDKYCPVISPKPITKKCCPVPSSPKKKQRKLTIESTSSSSATTPISVYNHHDDDCGVPATTPPPSPVVKKQVEQQVNRLHRQWATKWKSDGDLQIMLQKSLNSSSSSSLSSRKRTNSSSK